MLSLSSTTTSVVVKSTAKLAWPPMPCQWEQPEQSIGLPNGSLDLLGRIKCWSIKDKSPAAFAWKTISKSIINLLEDQYEHLGAKDSELMIEIFMIGKKSTSSSPTILFSCESKACRQKAMELVSKKGILACHPGIRMAECSKLPRRLATGEQSESPSLLPGVYLDGPMTSGGIAVLIARGSDVPLRKATVGGIFCVSGKYYGLTTAHAFEDAKANSGDSGSVENFEFAFYGSDDPDQNSEDEDEDEDASAMTSRASISSGSTHTPEDDTSEDNALGKSFLGPPPVVSSSKAITPPIKNETSPTRLGSRFSHPALSGDVDVALVRIENLDILGHAHNGTKPDHMINVIHWNDDCIFTEPLQEVADSQVLICTGRSDTPVQGRLSGTPSFTSAPGCHKFRELWAVRRFSGSFMDGDCGSWVVHPRTGALYGHLVSGYPDSGAAYILPASEIFRKCEPVLRILLNSSALADLVETVEKLPAIAKDQIPVPNSHGRAPLGDLDGSSLPGNSELSSTASNFHGRPEAPSISGLTANSKNTQVTSIFDFDETSSHRYTNICSIPSSAEEEPWDMSTSHLTTGLQRPQVISLFDWSEPAIPTINYMGTRPRESPTGRQLGRGRPNGPQIRSQSVPPAAAAAAKDASQELSSLTKKFGTWGLGGKGASEDWDDDFDFEDSDSETLSGSWDNVLIPPSIKAAQDNIIGQVEQIREIFLLVENLKRLRSLGRGKDLLDGPAAELWKEAEGLILLAIPDDGGAEEWHLSSPPPQLPFEDSEVLDDDYQRPEGYRHFYPKGSTDIYSEAYGVSPESDGKLGLKNPLSLPPDDDIFWLDGEKLLSTVVQAKLGRFVPESVAPSTKKIPFDNTSLRELVTRCKALSQTLASVIRDAEASESSDRQPQHD